MGEILLSFPPVLGHANYSKRGEQVRRSKNYRKRDAGKLQSLSEQSLGPLINKLTPNDALMAAVISG